MKTINIRSLISFILFAALFFQFSACNNSRKNEILLPQKSYENIKLKNLRYYYMPKQINGEIFNHSDYILTRLIFRFELYECDPNSRLKKLFDKTGVTYDLGEFKDFVETITHPQSQENFHYEVSKNFDIGSLSDLQKIVNDFQQSAKPLLLARKVELEVKIEPKFSENFSQTINSNYTTSNVIYDFKLEKAYGRNPN